jgi:hypothetical protein
MSVAGQNIFVEPSIAFDLYERNEHFFCIPSAGLSVGLLADILVKDGLSA